jgi:hypothetical protein
MVRSILMIFGNFVWVIYLISNDVENLAITFAVLIML